jgi:O-antigen ligase
MKFLAQKDIIGSIFLIPTLFLLTLPFLRGFARRFNFANLLLVLGLIERYYVDVGFALTPYMMLAPVLVVGLGGFRDLRMRFTNLLRELSPILPALVGLGASMVCSALATDFYIVSIRQIVLLALILGIVIVYQLYLRSAADLWKTQEFILRYSLILGVFGLAVAALYYGGMKGLASLREGDGLLLQSPLMARLRLFCTDPNPYGLYLLPLFFYCLVWLFICGVSGRSKRLPMVAVLVLTGNIVLTFSRGTLVSLAGGLMILLVFLGYKRGRLVFYFLVVVLLVVGFLIFTTSGKMASTLAEGYTSRASLFDPQHGRFSMWMEGLELSKRHILWGTGQGTIRDYSALHLQSHNTWVELLVENGLFSFLFMAILLVQVVFKGALKTRRLLARGDVRGYLLAGGVSGLVAMIMNMTSVSDISAVCFWLQVGYCLAMLQLFQERRSFSQTGATMQTSWEIFKGGKGRVQPIIGAIGQGKCQ